MAESDPYKNPWKFIEKEVVMDTPWLRVEDHKVITPSGQESRYGKVHYKVLAVGVIPIDEEGNTWIVGQYRYAMDCYSWEIVLGGGARDIAPIETARRELREETGIIAAEWTPILEMQMSNSVSDEVAHLFVAKGISIQQSRPDPDEILVVKKIPFEELYQMVMKGEIQDSFSIAGVLKAKLMMNEGKL